MSQTPRTRSWPLDPNDWGVERKTDCYILWNRICNNNDGLLFSIFADLLPLFLLAIFTFWIYIDHRLLTPLRIVILSFYIANARESSKFATNYSRCDWSANFTHKGDWLECFSKISNKHWCHNDESTSIKNLVWAKPKHMQSIADRTSSSEAQKVTTTDM